MLIDFREAPRKWRSCPGVHVVRNRELRRARIITGQQVAPTQVSRERGIFGQFSSCTGIYFLCCWLLKFLVQHGHRVVFVLTLSQSIFAHCWCPIKLCSSGMYSLRPTTSCQHLGLSFSSSHRNILTLHYQVRHANYQAFLSRVHLKKIMIICFENPVQINVF